MQVIDVETPTGPGRLSVSAPEQARAMLVLGHGAGGGVQAFDLVTLAHELPERGIAVALVEQPWRVAGRKEAGPAASLDKAWPAALDAAAAAVPGVPWFEGGRSTGARVACRCFAPPARGVIALSFPLHPPGKPEKSRMGELAPVAGPVLMVQGQRDPFGRPDELRAALAATPQAGERTVVEVPGATHSFGQRTGDAQASVARIIVDAVAAFVDERLSV